MRNIIGDLGRMMEIGHIHVVWSEDRRYLTAEVVVILTPGDICSCHYSAELCVAEEKFGDFTIHRYTLQNFSSNLSVQEPYQVGTNPERAESCFYWKIVLPAAKRFARQVRRSCGRPIPRNAILDFNNSRDWLQPENFEEEALPEE